MQRLLCRALAVAGAALLHAGCTPQAPGTGTVQGAQDAGGILAGSAPVEPAAGPVSRPWPADRGCPDLMAWAAALPEPERRMLEAETPPLAVAAVDRGAALPVALAAQILEYDLPAEHAATLDGTAARCLVLVERADAMRAAPRRLVAHTVVRSTYRRAGRSSANPEHAALKRSLRELDQDGGGGVMATGDPAIDLIGLVAGTVLGGIDAVRRRQAENEVLAALETTPRQIEEAVWEPYTYELNTVEAERAVSLRLALVDRAAGRFWPVVSRTRETRRFAIAEGRHAKDRDLLEGGGDAVLEADLDVWEQGAVRLRLSHVLGLVAAETRGRDGAAGDAARVLAIWSEAGGTRADRTGSGDGAAPAPAEAGRFMVRSAAGLVAARPAGAGRLSVPLSALGRSSLVEVIRPDGTRGYGLVAEIDTGRDLAIVRLGGPAAAGEEPGAAAVGPQAVMGAP